MVGRSAILVDNQAGLGRQYKMVKPSNIIDLRYIYP